MRAPRELDPDVLTVLEIVQHVAEVLSRVPLAALRAHLEQHRPDDPASEWYAKALNVTLAAQQLDAAQGILSAEEARSVVTVAETLLDDIPEDWR